MNEKSILSLLVGPGIFSNKELKEVASKAFNQKFLKEFDELNIKLPDDTRDDGRGGDDAADDASPISIDDEEEKKIMANTRTKQSQALFSQAAGKNLFGKSHLETVNFEDYDDEEENSASIPRQPILMMPKLKEFKPNPWEKLTNEQILTIVGTDRGHNIYALTDLYLPTTRETRGNVFKYLYKNLIRNPKDILRLHKGRHENAVVFEKEILRIFKLMYDQKFSLKQDTVVTKPPEASVSILKDSIKNPTAYSHDPIFSPLNSSEWFDSLQHDLMKGIQGENKMEVEREPAAEGRPDDAEPVPGSMNHNEAPLGRGMRDGRLIQAESSSRRVGNGTGNNNAGSKTEKYNLASLFESTPHRDEGEASVRSEDQSVANSYANGTPRNDGEMNGRGMYNRTLNQNMREYLNDHYEKDRKALFSFYTGLKGHDKNETALWGETNKEEVNDFDMLGMTTTKGNINYNYMVLPFRNDKERSIFKYQTDFQDDSEIEFSLLHKKRRITREHDVKVKPGSYDNLYFNKNVLEASWNDFFFKPTATIPKEKEYSLVLIDLNDKSIFYDKIHPHVFGVQKASKKILTAIADLPDNPVDEAQMEDHMDIPENPEMQNFAIEGTATKQPSYMLTQGERTQHAPSESDSISIKKTDTTARRTKERLKNLRITAVKQGYDPDKLTMENARVLLDKPGKTESKAGSVSLPPILRLVKDLTRKISTSAVIQHSKVAEEFHFNEFHIKRQDYEYFHRPDLRKLLEKDKHAYPWRIEIVKQEEEKKDPESVLDDPFGVNELVDSFEYFKNHKRLSLREGKFALFEYIEENPLIISNIGMASRINRYVYPYRAYAKVKAKQAEKGITNENEELMEFVKMIKQTLGEKGSITFLEDKQSLPLIGQLTNERFIGVTIMDNNLFYAPIFIHKAPETDFVLVRYLSSDGSRRYYLRKIEYIYTVGQIEPKVEVFNPSCRSLTSFIRKSIKFIIKKKFANNESVHMEEMKQLFPTVNDHNMKKYIQYFGGDPDPDDNKRFFYNKDLDHEQNEEDPERNEGNITPEEVCQYERMHASNVRLKNIGLEDLRSCDKINTIRNRYIKRNNLKIWNDTVQGDKRNLVKMNIVANYVSEELQLTAWNLSQSFLSSKQKQGRLFLTGFGDPTAGHGGYSYVKLPLKTSRYEKEEKKNNAQKNSQVTGTNADLRKLPIKLVDKMITDYGDYKEEHISKLTRWDKIDLLRQIANEHPDNEELAKYARAFRLTTKMQREKYQKDINNLFMTLIDNLSKPGSDEIQDDTEVEFECNVEQLVDKELDETMKRMPKDQNEQMEDEDKDDDEDEMPDDNMNSYDM